MSRFDRWFPVVGGVLMNMALGTFYASSAFMLPLEKQFGWTRAQTSWVTTIGIVMIASWYVVAGYVQDRFGPRLVAAAGGLLFSAGFFLGSFTNSLVWFYATMGGLVGMGNGFGYVVPTSVGSKWFPDKRGLIIGLMVGGYGAGSGIFGPLASTLIGRVGWQSTLRALALLFLCMTMAASYLLRNPTSEQVERLAGMGAGPQVSGRDVPASTMIRSRTFWLLWIAYACGATAGTMVISQLVPFASAAGHTAAVAAFAITVGALGNASGRICSGWLSDHIGRVNTLRLMLALSALAMPALFIMRENVVWFYVLLAAVYYCYGTQLSVYASTSADFWGTRNIGFNYGLLLLAWGVAGILGPFLGGRVYVATGEYWDAFLAAAALSVLAVASLSLIRRPQHVARHVALANRSVTTTGDVI
jgi:OFA family oxalate/formate antiporter-like MFS transporter